MSSRTHRLVGLLALAVGLLVLTAFPEALPTARGQKAAVPTIGPVGKVADEKAAFTEAVTVPINRESKGRIQAAQDYIKKKEWGTVVEALQSLLEDQQDSFIELDPTPGDKGKAAKRRVSVRTEANRLIGELPPDGLETYQVKYGQTASDHLRAALDANDPALLAEVAIRYLHTKAGGDATNLLGTYHLDRGSYLMANLSFERLLSRPDADQLPAKVLFKAALAARRAGDTANAEKVWRKLAEKAGRGDLVFGTRKVTLDQARAEFEKAVATVVAGGQNDWWLFRGNPARNAQGVGGTAYLEPHWQYDMARIDEFANDQDETRQTNKKIRDFVQQSVTSLDGKPILPTFFPVAANGRLLVRSYDGIHAIAMRNENTAQGPVAAGNQVWASQADGSLYSLCSRADRYMTLQGWYEAFYRNQGSPNGVFFENSTIGTLSHDLQRAYFVDDLAVPPHPNVTQLGFAPPVSYGGLTKEVNYSRLRAVELDGGKLVWTLGRASNGPHKDKDDNAKQTIAGLEFADTFFLGPPLPLGGKLYVLVEKNTEFRLVCLDPGKIVNYEYVDDNGKTAPDQCPDLVWQQSLGTAQDRLPHDSVRRMQACHLAYADGVLVCPTNAGIVVGVDLLSHSLIWAHSYRDGIPQAVPDEMQMIMRGRGIRPGFAINNGTLSPERWRTSAPIIQNGKVVFTAHDGGEIHCLNLRDGRLLWHVKREDDDLYLGGVFGTRVVLVGKNHTRSLNLDDGKELWKVATGMPSGQGAASEDIYYLPLAWATDDPEKKPAILAINLASGKPVGPPAKSRKKEAIGNLAFIEGELVSQTALKVSAFPELKQMLAEIERRLKDNPIDPVGLTERGELFLDKGDLKRAVEDFRTAVANKPSADVLEKARTKLHEALTELLQSDFPAAEKYLDEYHALCQIDVPANADANAKLRAAEKHQSREANYLSLLGRGRERQGRLLDAFAAYDEFGALTGNKELVSVVDEPNTKSRPDVWSRGRIKGMVDRANPEQRKQLEAAIEKKWDAIRDAGDLNAIRRFVAVFGTSFKVGREAQLILAERLLAAGGPDDLTDAETKLQGLCFSPEVRRLDPPAAAKAIEAMIRIYLKRGLYEDAVNFYKQLGAEFANVPVRDGKTGADLLNELFTDKRFLPYLEPLGMSWKGTIRGHDTPGNFRASQMTLNIEPESDAVLPFFQRHRVVMDVYLGGNQLWTLRLLDRATGEEQCRFADLQAAPYFLNGGVAPRFAFAAGHTLVVHLNYMVYAFNLAERKKLWEYSLNKSTNATNNNQILPDADGRGLEVVDQFNRREKLGGVGLACPSYVVLNTREGLVALDPTRAASPPSILWTKSGVSVRAQLFGDDEHVYVVESSADNAPPTIRALRAQDGVTVPVPDFSRLFARRIRTYGRQILLQDDDPHGGKSLRLYDVQTGQDVWKQKFMAGAVVIQSQDPEITGVIEKDNTATLMNGRTGKVLFKSLILPEHAANLDGGTLFADRDRYYLALTRKADNGVNWAPSATFGIRSLRVNGPLYALSRASGKLEWVCDFIPHQMLLLEQVEDLPLLLFASQYNTTGNGIDRPMVKVTGVDKRNGKLIYDREFAPNQQFHTLRIDPNAGVIELTGLAVKIQLRMENTQAAKAGSQNPVEQAVPALAPGLAAPIR